MEFVNVIVDISHEKLDRIFQYRIPEPLEGKLEEGMVTTDEPGVYVEGKYGIRIESELICKKWQKNEYGQYLKDVLDGKYIDELH